MHLQFCRIQEYKRIVVISFAKKPFGIYFCKAMQTVGFEGKVQMILVLKLCSRLGNGVIQQPALEQERKDK